MSTQGTDLNSDLIKNDVETGLQICCVPPASPLTSSMRFGAIASIVIGVVLGLLAMIATAALLFARRGIFKVGHNMKVLA